MGESGCTYLHIRFQMLSMEICEPSHLLLATDGVKLHNMFSTHFAVTLDSRKRVYLVQKIAVKNTVQLLYVLIYQYQYYNLGNEFVIFHLSADILGGSL